MFDHLAAEPVYNTRAVVQRTGVPADTFRAWERRYGLPRPARSPGNQRLYSDRDIATIAWLRDQTRTGVTISHAVTRLRSTTLESTADDGATRHIASRAGGRHAPHPALEAHRADVVDALLSFDGRRADRLIEEAIALGSVEDFCLMVLQPALVEMGTRCEQGISTIGAVRFADSYVRRKLGALFNLSMPDVGRGPILAATLEGELDEFELLLASLLCSRRGYRLVYLGANVPLESLIEAAATVRPALIALAASTRTGAKRLGSAIEELEGRLGTLKPVISGGSTRWPPVVGFLGAIFGIQTDLKDRISGTFLGNNAGETVTEVDEILAGIA